MESSKLLHGFYLISSSVKKLQVRAMFKALKGFELVECDIKYYEGATWKAFGHLKQTVHCNANASGSLHAYELA